MTIFEASLSAFAGSPDQPLQISEIVDRIRQRGLVRRTGKNLYGSVRTRLAEHVRITPISEQLVARIGKGRYTLTARDRATSDVN